MPLHPVQDAADPLRYGVIGPGAHATEHLLPALAQLGGGRVVTVAARSAASARAAAERWGAASWTDDWTDVVDPAVVDAVLVAATPEVHAAVIRRCLERGIHAFVEKPPAPATAELEELCALERAQTAPPVVFVGLNFAYGESYRRLREAVGRGGAPRAVDVRLVSSKPLAPADGHATVEATLLQGLGLHAVDLVVRELGPPDGVSAHVAVIDRERRAIRVTLSYRDGRLGTVHVGNGSNRLEYRCEITNDQGAVGVLDQHNVLTLAAPAGAGAPARIDGKEIARYEWPSRRGGYGRTGYLGALAAFQRSIAEGTPSDSGLEACLAAYRVLDEAGAG